MVSTNEPWLLKKSNPVIKTNVFIYLLFIKNFIFIWHFFKMNILKVPFIYLCIFIYLFIVIIINIIKSLKYIYIFNSSQDT